jgi:hypothetical protein
MLGVVHAKLRWVSLALGSLLLGAVVALLVGGAFAASRPPQSATWLLAVAGAGFSLYAVIAVVSVMGSPLLAHIWCLRLPASAVIGTVAILALTKWAGYGPEWWQVLGVALVFAGYTAFEARHQNTGPWASMKRSTLVTALGCLHGVAVASMALAAVGPLVFSSGAGRWSWLPVGQRLLWAVVFMGVTSVLVGTVLQVLWSERSTCSPLDHMTWSRQ